MSVEIINRTSGNKLKVDTAGQLAASVGPNYIGSAGGRYRMSLSTNLATVISAITATGDVGQIGQFRWGSTTKTCLIDRLEMTFQVVTDFTAFQTIKLGIRKVSAHTATATGGTTTASLATIALLTGDSGKLRASYPTTALTDFRMTDTADLTCGAGARALDAQDFLTLVATPKSDGATIAKPLYEKVWDGGARGQPLVLTQDTGISIMNHTLWGAAGTARVGLAVEWREILNAEVPTF